MGELGDTQTRIFLMCGCRSCCYKNMEQMGAEVRPL